MRNYCGSSSRRWPRQRKRVAAAGRSPRGAALLAAPLFSLGAAAAELLAVPLAAPPRLGGVLAALAVVQLLAGVAALIRPTRRVLLAAGGATLALLAFWAVSRWTGLFLGPNLWLAKTA